MILSIVPIVFFILSFQNSLVASFNFETENSVGGFSNEIQIAIETGECLPPFVKRNTKCYYLSKTRANWFHAAQFCHTHNSDLLTIDDTKENEFIQTWLKRNLTQWNDFAWTGGTDQGRIGEWMWMSTGQKIDPCVMKWSYSNPDNSGGIEHCVGFFKEHGFQWNDYECNQEGHFMCQAYINTPKYNPAECVNEIRGMMSAINFTLATYKTPHQDEIMVAIETALYALPLNEEMENSRNTTLADEIDDEE